jgi:hypothetical protein
MGIGQGGYKEGLTAMRMDKSDEAIGDATRW